MGNEERWQRHRRAQANAGKPLGGGLDPVPPLPGKASLAALRIQKPVEKGGRRGLEVSFVATLESMKGLNVLVEITLHEQGRGPFRSTTTGFTNTIGNFEVFAVETPTEERAEVRRAVFIPFAAIEVEHPGTLKCFARVQVAEGSRGVLATEEIGFELEAG